MLRAARMCELYLTIPDSTEPLSVMASIHTAVRNFLWTLGRAVNKTGSSRMPALQVHNWSMHSVPSIRPYAVQHPGKGMMLAVAHADQALLYPCWCTPHLQEELARLHGFDTPRSLDPTSLRPLHASSKYMYTQASL